ncbi:MAG: hypothetical protein VXW70_05305 [Candidatus Thermoplasmatota archaeon]|nr:hypothetical protein [Candidatus Thermoplasmatota archaeon]MEC8249160.1 hypothetical protein [Candidatus Thermoplasmatota archaeon]MEC8313353.1 hypothetical protein [Candidatus Thermoplasmatota archaeon]MEC8353193.1 hypothetical protein [Candidatus Thermoplasmatota archaeon]
MTDKVDLLCELYQARFDRLKEIASSSHLPKNGPVEIVRARLIRNLVLSDWDLSKDNIKSIKNKHLGEILGVFGLKKSGSIRERRQRLYLHLYEDPKILTTENLDEMNKQDIHALCKTLELPLTGDKQTLLVRVAGVLASQQGSWGKVKKSLKRKNDNAKAKIVIPNPADDEEQTVVTVQDTVDKFIEEHPDGWSFEEESQLRSNLAEDGLDISRVDVSNTIDDALKSVQVQENEVPSIPQMNQTAASIVVEAEIDTLEREAAILEVDSRMAEIESSARDFLTVSSTSNSQDFESFISSLANHGIPVDIMSVRAYLSDLIMKLEFKIESEKQAINSMPNSWSEREAIRQFENSRSSLRDQLSNTIDLHNGDLVKARMGFEEIAKTMGLDLRIPSISGRLHALFDLHVDLSEAEGLQDPNIARRNRVLKVLHHGSIHHTPEERRVIDRLERNITAFEQLVETVMESSEGKFTESQQALIVRFLESRGYDVNTPDLRPKVLASAGIIGAELGFISPSEIPKIAPGVIVSETEVDSIITELKSLASSFRPSKNNDLVEEIIAEDESLSDAGERLKSAKEKIDHIDDVLARLRG